MKIRDIISGIILFCSLPLSAQVVHPIVLCGSEPLSVVSDDAVLLHDGWQMRESYFCGNDGCRFSTLKFPASDWYSTTVPATVLSVLVNHGVYPNPYIGMNAMQIPDASDDFNERYGLARYTHLPDGENPWHKPYWFRNKFYIPDTYSGKTVWLNLDGINYRADVFINGKKVEGKETLVGMFRRFRLDVSDYIVAGGQNAMAICIYPLDHPGDPVHAQIEGFRGQLGPNGGDSEISRDLTMYCSSGWDWIPQVPDRNMGIWQHVWLNATESVRVTDPAVFTDLDLPDVSKADAKVRFYARNISSKVQKVTFEAEIFPDGFAGETITVSRKTTLNPNSRTEIIFDAEEFPQLVLRDPELWYPAGYGEQPLYNIRVRAYIGKKLSSEETRRFGVREFSSYLLASGGRAFEVNGVPIRMSGGSWVPDMMLTWDAQRYRDEVRLMASGNASFVRIHGSGIIVPDCFLDACDEYGLLVWQDLMRSSYSPDFRKFEIPKNNGYYWYPTPADSTLYMDNMVDAIERLRGHAAFCLYCGSNEATPQENTTLALQDKVLPEMDGTRIFIVSSHEQPGWANTKIGMTTGGPWDMKRLPEYWNLYRTDDGFTGRNEIGLTSPPNINTLAKSMPDYDQPDETYFPFNVDMGFHDATGWPIHALDRIMREDMGNPADITEYLWWSDLYNSASFRAIYEAANSMRPRNSGTMLWKTNASWSSFNWQLYDWYLRPNSGYYSSRSALKPVHVQFDIDSLDVKLINALPEKLENYKTRIRMYSADGVFLDEIDKSVSVGSNANATVSRLPEFVNDGNLYFVALLLSDSNGKEIDRSVQWYQKEMKWDALTKLSPAKIEVDFISVTTENEENKYHFMVKNMSSTPAVNIMLELVQGYQGMEILPSFWSDNALTLMPNERMEIDVKVRKTSVAKIPHLMIEGLNILPQEIDFFANEKVMLSLQVNDFRLQAMDGKTFVEFMVESKDAPGARVNTWLIPVKINGKLFRNVIVGCKSGGKSSGLIDISGLETGIYIIEVGDVTKEIVMK